MEYFLKIMTDRHLETVHKIKKKYTSYIANVTKKLGLIAAIKRVL